MSTKHKKMTIDTVLNDEEKLVVRYMANEGNVSYDEQLAEIFRENIEHYVELYLGQAQNWQKEKELIMSAEEPEDEKLDLTMQAERGR